MIHCDINTKGFDIFCGFDCNLFLWYTYTGNQTFITVSLLESPGEVEFHKRIFKNF